MCKIGITFRVTFGKIQANITKENKSFCHSRIFGCLYPRQQYSDPGPHLKRSDATWGKCGPGLYRYMLSGM